MEAINEVFFDYYYIDLFKDILIRDIDLTYFKEKNSFMGVWIL